MVGRVVRDDYGTLLDDLVQCAVVKSQVSATVCGCLACRWVELGAVSGMRKCECLEVVREWWKIVTPRMLSKDRSRHVVL